MGKALPEPVRYGLVVLSVILLGFVVLNLLTLAGVLYKGNH